MSAIYLHDDLAFDYGLFQNQARLLHGNIDDYFKHFRQFLKEKEERVRKASEGGEVIVEIQGDEIADLINDMLQWSKANSAQTVYNCLFIMTNSFLEWGMIECCRLGAIYINDDFLTYTNGRGIEKARNYLKEKLNIPLSAGGKEWNRFKVNQDIRNMIVHNGANIVVDYNPGKEVSNQPLYKMVENNKKVFYLTETGFVYIKDIEYIEESHKWAVEFVQQTLDAVTVGLRNRGVRWT